MSVPYYSTPELQRALVAEAMSWVGTPFRENCAVKGPQGGVSCEQLQAAIHTALGACAPLQLKTLPVEVVRHWHEHHAESRIMAWLAQPELRGRVRRVDEGAASMIGDLLVLQVKRTEHHLALDCGAVLVHVAIPAGVVAHGASDPQLQALVRCRYRIFRA